MRSSRRVISATQRFQQLGERMQLVGTDSLEALGRHSHRTFRSVDGESGYERWSSVSSRIPDDRDSQQQSRRVRLQPVPDSGLD
jgi:hypothetical protein